ncbi:hypothetical protein [Candidatus Enterovibrio escicola]|nr:hypothetical protein [Candidatus Enterovibrio escacola]
MQSIVHLLCATQVNYNVQVSEALANVKAMNQVLRFGMPVCQ